MFKFVYVVHGLELHATLLQIKSILFLTQTNKWTVHCIIFYKPIDLLLIEIAALSWV